ncbi:phosphoglycerate dehydrogenase [Jeotgalibaca ciconiae]|uniref:D-3-phosphoglycerate dehydrogenase n=1 Tax=Jeotgalibaca ciconiae TaxID=2496265 RepID=A0A3Q9BIM4_9LACT|nr:phosphoglycerate dehydrogenase [Jeotgalibaca ciconiae]AZP03233.1 3-phosphoglycerate dehydrogenase [Jeotgalibaca ciconiae]HJB24347.1 phosphoglycerate dehydrogenase [Candidatus Jeotgalibaca pullicola]
MKDIQTFNMIATEGLNLLEKDKYTLNETKEPEALLLRSKKIHDMAFNENLVSIARAGAGVNNIPVDRCSEEGIVVFNTPGANANAVKEMVIAGLIMAARPIYRGINWLKELEGDDISEQVEAGKKQFAGRELAGKTLGVIGLGAIGSLLATDAYHLKMDVIGYDPYVSVETAWNISSRVKKAKSLQEVLRDADYISIHIPVNGNTAGYVNKEFINMMKDGAVLLNFARNELIVKEDLIEALDNGKLSKYVTDFAEREFFGHDRIMMFPHLGASTEEAEVQCSIMAVNTLKYFLETGNIINSVNFPTIDVPLQSAKRITIVNRNVPNMIGQISAILAKHFVNIDNILNRSRGNFAYTVIDIPEIESSLLEEVINQVQEINGVLKTRVIERK